MERREHDIIVSQILEGVRNSTSTVERTRLMKARMRCLGDELGEPIILEEKGLSDHYIRVEIPINSSLKFMKSDSMVVAMTPKAAKMLLARGGWTPAT